jgi:cytochrome c peroxidase
VVEHYVKGGVVKTNLSPSLKSLTLNTQEKSDLVSFLRVLTSVPHGLALPNTKTSLPLLP